MGPLDRKTLRALILVAMLIALLLIAVLLAWKGRVRQEAGRIVLRYSPPIRIGATILLVGFGLLVPILLAVVAFVVPLDGPGDALGLAGFGLFAVLTGALTWIESRRRFLVSADGIKVQSPWRRAYSLRWQEIMGVQIPAPVGPILLTESTGRTLRFSPFLDGLGALAQVMAQHLAPTVYRDASDMMRRMIERQRS
jgi:hypothetical protein